VCVGMRVVCRVCLWVVWAETERRSQVQRMMQCVCGMRMVCVGMRVCGVQAGRDRETQSGKG